MQATIYRQIYSTIMNMRVPASHHHLVVYLIYTLYRLDHLVSTPASASQPGYHLLSSTLSFPPSLPVPCPPNLPNPPSTSAPPKSTAHSFAFSSTVPTLSRSLYFFNTPSLWYFQNCFEASLPTTRFKIFAPPGCSSTNPIHHPH